MDAFYALNQSLNSWEGLTKTADFKERVSYDGNGNIQKYNRNNFGETGLAMDSLEYAYLYGTNKLGSIKDGASDAVGGGYDLHNQPTGNYAYDSIGNLIKDSAENISAIKWNVYGKITEIDHRVTSLSRPTKNIYYYYDAAGHRVGKKVTRGDTTAVAYTWYVRDASGNVMATYSANIDSSRVLDSADLKIGEKHLYGSSRLGILTAGYSTDANTNGMSIYTSPWTGVHLPYYSGKKQYELSNHLGNVLATISDKKIGVSLATDSSLIDHYGADVQTAHDYYPFGMVMPGRMFAALSIPGGSFSGQTQVNGYTVPVDLSLNSRSGNDPAQYAATRTIDLEDGFTSSDNDDLTAYLTDTTYNGAANVSSDGSVGGSSGKYRYGFNGQEKSDEIKGVGNSYNADFWEYDPRISRRWNIDPKPTQGFSPYSAFNGNPIFNADPLGDTILPRHPIDLKKSPSEIGFVPYNAIGSLANGAEGFLHKAGEYLDHPMEQFNDDMGSIGDFIASQYNYYTKTPADQIKKDTKDFLSNPDNYFHAAEDAFAILAAGKFSISEVQKISKISVSERFSLKEVVTETPADLARKWQGHGDYPGIDIYKNITLKAGTQIAAGLPGESNYFTTLSGLVRTNGSANRLWEGLQVKPHETFGYRMQMGIYEVTGDTKAAMGITRENIAHGVGGLPQLFIPNTSNLKLIKTFDLHLTR